MSQLTQQQTDLRTGDRSIGELFARASQDLSTIVRNEIELAKVELRQDVAQVKRGGAMFAGTAALAYLAVLMVAFAAAWGLAAIMPTGWAFLIVAVVCAIAAFVSLQLGKRAMRDFTPGPEQTIETLREDLQWARHPRS